MFISRIDLIQAKSNKNPLIRIKIPYLSLFSKYTKSNIRKIFVIPKLHSQSLRYSHMLHGTCYVDTIFHPKQIRPVAEDDVPVLPRVE